MFCDLIRFRRLELGMIQSQVAFSLGTDQRTVSFWEGNRCIPRSGSLARIAGALSLSLADVQNSYEYSKRPRRRIRAGKCKAGHTRPVNSLRCSECPTGWELKNGAKVGEQFTKRRRTGPPRSGFYGVYGVNYSDKYRARLKVDGRQIYAGTFATPEAAARAYDAYVVEHGLHKRTGYGPKHKLNFPEEHQ
jgi:transcriptional regulator with XRE-family HTH domain